MIEISNFKFTYLCIYESQRLNKKKKLKWKRLGMGVGGLEAQIVKDKKEEKYIFMRWFSQHFPFL